MFAIVICLVLLMCTLIISVLCTVIPNLFINAEPYKFFNILWSPPPPTHLFLPAKTKYIYPHYPCALYIVTIVMLL